MDEVKDTSLSKLESDSPYCLPLCHFLSYPFVVCSGTQKFHELSIISLQSRRKLELENVIEIRKLLYVSVNFASQFGSSTSNSFANDLSLALNGCSDEGTMVLECGTGLPSNNYQIHVADTEDGGNKPTTHYCFNVKGFLRVGVFCRLSSLEGRNFVVFPDNAQPLLQWLTYAETPCEDINHQLQLLWTKTLDCFQRSHLPLIFDPSLLKLQASLLEKTLDHPNPSISESTIPFWKSTFASEKLEYPQNLLPVLDKLSRNGKISLCKRSPPFIRNCCTRITATQKRSSKRVELVEDEVRGIERNGKQPLCPKRKGESLPSTKRK